MTTVTTHPLPFRPSFPVVAPNGATFWSCYYGGLWTWAPRSGRKAPRRHTANLGHSLERRRHPPQSGHQARDGRLSEGPPSSGVGVDARHEPCHAGVLGRQWRVVVTMRTRRMDRRSVSSCRCRPRDRTLQQSFEVACHFPVSVAWAGRSIRRDIHDGRSRALLFAASAASGGVSMTPGGRTRILFIRSVRFLPRLRRWPGFVGDGPPPTSQC